MSQKAFAPNDSLQNIRKQLHQLKLELIGANDEVEAELPVISASVSTPDPASRHTHSILRSPLNLSPRSSAAANSFDLSSSSRSSSGAANVSTLSSQFDTLGDDSNATVQELRHKLQNREATLEELTKSHREEQMRAAHAASSLSLKEQQITTLQQQLAALQQQHSLEQYYHQRLFQTLGAEFVIAIKHIAHLESVMSERGLAVPSRPDFAHHDIDAPPLPAELRGASTALELSQRVNEQAASFVASAALGGDMSDMMPMPRMTMEGNAFNPSVHGVGIDPSMSMNGVSTDTGSHEAFDPQLMQQMMIMNGAAPFAIDPSLSSTSIDPNSTIDPQALEMLQQQQQHEQMMALMMMNASMDPTMMVMMPSEGSVGSQ